MKKYDDFIKENFGMDLEPTDNEEHKGHEMFDELDDWKKESTAFAFAIRSAIPDIDDEDQTIKRHFDMWLEIDYSKPQETANQVGMMKLRAGVNNDVSRLYACWLPNELADEIKRDDNPDDYYDLIMSVKFTL